MLFPVESVSYSIKSVLYAVLPQAELALDVLKSLLGLNSTSEERLPCSNRIAIKTGRPRNTESNEGQQLCFAYCMMNLEIHIQSVWRDKFMRPLQSWTQLRRWSSIVQRRKSMRPSLLCEAKKRSLPYRACNIIYRYTYYTSSGSGYLLVFVLACSTTLLSGFSCGRAQRIAGERRQPATGATSLRQHEGQSRR